MRIYITEYRFMELDIIYGAIPDVGQLCTLVEYRHELTGEKWYTLGPSTGIGGNADPKIKRYHGWRGTTNNVAAYAKGQRRLEAVGQFKNGTWYLDLSKDLKPDED